LTIDVNGPFWHVFIIFMSKSFLPTHSNLPLKNIDMKQSGKEIVFNSPQKKRLQIPNIYIWSFKLFLEYRMKRTNLEDLFFLLKGRAHASVLLIF